MKLGLLVSGALGLKIFEDLLTANTISFVLTDKASSAIIELAGKNNIPLFAGNPRGKDVLTKLNNPYCDLILSVNYLFIVTEEIFTYPRLGAINFHGSLLPKYRGRTPHVWAIINNETETGITAHYINEGCDTGDIIKQLVIPISREATGDSILKIYKSLYPAFVSAVMEEIKTNSIISYAQNHEEATYYGKRQPQDGQINWNWQKERIYNWVRAQANPYPGAFSFIQNETVVIHKIEFCQIGFSAEIENGTVIAIEDFRPVIKTQNGAVKLIDYIYNGNFEVGQMLY